MRGRCARQGDPGQTVFFVSIEDDLIRRHGIAGLIAELGEISPGQEIANPKVGANIAHVQRVIEGENFQIRRTLRLYSNCLEQQRLTIQQRRHKLLNGTEAPALLRGCDGELYQRLIDRFGADAVQRVERQITIWQIDQCWSDHLAEASAIRDQIYLMSMAGSNPLDEFHRQITRAFSAVSQRIDREVVATFRAIPMTDDGIELVQRQLIGPSSTWTYMINDNPMGSNLERIMRTVKRSLELLKKQRA